jgi:hypothetical protein
VNVNLAQTATGLEWSYTIGAFFTFCVLVYLTQQAARDRDWQTRETQDRRTPENRAALTDARGQLEKLIYMTLIALTITLMGLDFMLTPPANPHHPITPAGVVLAVCLLIIEGLLLLMAIRSFRIRVVAIRQYRQSIYRGAERRDHPLEDIPTQALLDELRKRGEGATEV